MSYDTSNRVLSTYSLFLKIFFGMKAPHKLVVDSVRAGLLNMSEKEENVGAGYLVHMFWGVLDDLCRHFRNLFSPEAAQARYMKPEGFRLPGTRLGHISENWYVTSH